jgi:hypothetical protein
MVADRMRRERRKGLAARVSVGPHNALRAARDPCGSQDMMSSGSQALPCGSQAVCRLFRISVPWSALLHISFHLTPAISQITQPSVCMRKKKKVMQMKQNKEKERKKKKERKKELKS